MEDYTDESVANLSMAAVQPGTVECRAKYFIVLVLSH